VLRFHLYVVQETRGSEGFVASLAGKQDLLDTTEIDSKSVGSPDLSESAKSTLRVLDCLKHLFRYGVPEGISQPQDSFLYLISTFFLLSDTQLVSATRDTVFAYIRSAITSNVSTSEKRDDGIAMWWSMVEQLVAHGSTSTHLLTAYQLWLRLLSRGPRSSTILQVLATDNYWVYLQRALASGDSERRKTSLEIFRASLVLADQKGLGIDSLHLVLGIESNSKGTPHRDPGLLRLRAA